MKAKDLAAALGMKIVQPAGEDNDVAVGYTSDLLSDVMAGAKEGCALITVQAHVNTVAVAALVGAAAIVICSDRPVTGDMVEAAAREEIPILVAESDQFTTSHLIYEQIKG